MEPKKSVSLKRRWKKFVHRWETQVTKMNKAQKFKFAAPAAVFVLLVLVFILTGAFPFKNTFTSNSLPPAHGLYQYEVKSSSPLIFPPIEHQPTLKKMGYKNLFLRASENSDYFVKTTNKPLTDKERKQLANEENSKSTLVKTLFLDHGKTVYRKTTQPEVVIVTMIDYENFHLDSTVQIVQNRIDYAQKHHYGTYIRWAQEFIPFVEKQTLEESYEYMKPLMMRAAMNAFPKAKYFWFVDKNSLIMRLDLPLQSQILDPKVLEFNVLKGVHIDSHSMIKTHLTFDPKATIIIPQQQETSDATTLSLDFNSFIMANDMYSHCFLDYLSDPLIRNYRWSSFSQCVSHVLQWHPILLRKTMLINPKKIASIYDQVSSVFEKPSGKEKVTANQYEENDMVVEFKGCVETKSCGPLISKFYRKINRT
ncbi:hypothetical protein ACO0QE_002152 [Hanseniaspora vineae]